MQINKNKIEEFPLVSVIVPVYNTEKYLNRCIDSIVKQTYKNIEIILVDDCSKDNCREICDKRSQEDSRIKLISKRENQGLFKARISGINASSGEYIMFVDSDDAVCCDCIETLYNILLKSKSLISAVKLACVNDDGFSFNACRQKNVISGEDFEVLNFDGIFKYLDRYDLWSTCGKLYKKELFKDLNIFNDDYYFSEDLITNYYVYKKAEFISVSAKKMYIYFQHPDSIMHNNISSDRIKWQLKIYKCISDDMNKKSLAYYYFIAGRINNDYLLAKNAIFSDDKKDEFLLLKKDLKECLKFAFYKCNRSYFTIKKLLSIILLIDFSGLYKILNKS